MDRVNAETRRSNMQAIRSTGMKPEMVVRRVAHGLGYRYRLHRHDLPGRPDIVFPGRRKIIFVHGCFWHQHSDPCCSRAHRPKSNNDYWEPKLRKTQERDRANIAALEKMGWEVLVIWECQTENSKTLSCQIDTFLRDITP